MKLAEAIVLPRAFGEKTGKILKWKVLKGDRVKAGQILAELVMGDAVLELESFTMGSVLHLEAKENEMIHVGDLIAIIGEDGADIDSILEKHHNPQQKFENRKILMEGFIGEIKMFAGNYIPENWKLCDGSELKTKDYPDLGRVFRLENDTSIKLPEFHLSGETKYIICVKGKTAK